jgi:hypothetical protein
MARTLTNKPRSKAGFRTLPGFGKHTAQIEASNEAMLEAGFYARPREQKALRPSPYDDIRPSHG